MDEDNFTVLNLGFTTVADGKVVEEFDSTVHNAEVLTEVLEAMQRVIVAMGFSYTTQLVALNADGDVVTSTAL